MHTWRAEAEKARRWILAAENILVVRVEGLNDDNDRGDKKERLLEGRRYCW